MATGKGEEGKLALHFTVSNGAVSVTRKVFSVRHNRFIVDVAGVPDRGKSSTFLTREQAHEWLDKLMDGEL